MKKLLEYDNVIQEQIDANIIEPVDLAIEKNSDNISYLPHNAVFKQSSDSTKCRVVFLSNLKERNTGALSHNQISKPGVNLNHKLAIALLLLRFDKILLTFDLRKAFHQLMLTNEDTEQLRFLWFKDVAKHDFTIVSYRICRLPMGMRYSPFLLMISLYYMLIVDTSEDVPAIRDIKKSLYDLAFMDNISYTSNSSDAVIRAIGVAQDTFSDYKFELQQFACNDSSVRNYLDSNVESQPSTEEMKLLGTVWNTNSDLIKPRQLNLDISADTKRKVLSTFQSNFDPIGIYTPVLNRAKLFIHGLQKNTKLNWDDKLDSNALKQWRNISAQVNRSAELSIDRFLGERDAEYSLLLYTDASKELIGCAVYLRHEGTGRIGLVLARNSVVDQDRGRTIPCLELAAMHFGVETVMDLYSHLSSAVIPINIKYIHAFTDSIISLCWLKSKVVTLDKIDRKNVFVNNKLDAIVRLCNTHPIIFDHVAGEANLSDCVTRETSCKSLIKSGFLGGEAKHWSTTEYVVKVPHAYVKPKACTSAPAIIADHTPMYDGGLSLNRFSSFTRSVKCMSFVYKFLYLKLGWHPSANVNHVQAATSYLIKRSQNSSFPNVIKSLLNKDCRDPLVSQLNLFVENGIVRVKGMMGKLRTNYDEKCPILLDKSCPLTSSIISDAHLKLGHAGVYKTLAELRKRFWITKGFMCVKKVIKQCLVCARLNNRSVKLNQGQYKDFRVNPDSVPYRNISVDHCGPFQVKTASAMQESVYILVITCLWSRAVNLCICRRINKDCYLRALQLHVFEFGVPSFIVSDNGTPIVSGTEEVINYLKDDDTMEYFNFNNIKQVQFSPYPANSPHLGGFVESMVKQVKRILVSSVGRNVLTYTDFEFVVAEAKMLINKRPVAFKNNLSSQSIAVDPLDVLTPELIVKGYVVPSVNVVPPLGDAPDQYEPGCTNNELYKRYDQLRSVKNKLEHLYQNEFRAHLMHQALDRKDKYVKRSHVKLKPGDLVSIKTDNYKPFDYPLAIVESVETNDLSEVTAATVRKSNNQRVRRHVTNLIFLSETQSVLTESREANSTTRNIDRPSRKAAVRCIAKNRDLLQNE